MGPFGLPVEPEPAIAFPRGCRVRVNDDLLGGLGLVVIPIAMSYEHSLVGVEFDDAPGFVWQFRRRDVEIV